MSSCFATNPFSLIRDLNSATTTGPSAPNTPVASSSALSSILTTSSIPSSTPTPDPSSVPIFVTSSSSDAPPTSIPSAQASQSLAPSQSPTSSPSSGAVSFFHNKPAMIATFTAAGVLVIILVFVLGTVVLRRSRRRGLVKAALDYSPTTVHFVNNDDGEGGGGSFSRSDSSSSYEAHGRRPSVGSVSASGPALAPAPAPIPLSVPAPREMQGVGTGFASARYAYGSAPAYYDPVRQQSRPQPQPQQQPQRQLRRQQQQDEWPLPPDLPSFDTVRHPSALIPAYHRDLTAFDVPFAATTTTTTTTATTAAKPSRYSGDGGLPAGPRVSRMSQVPLPPPARFPNALSRVDESPEDVSTVSGEDRRNRPRVLKVRRCSLRRLLVADRCVAWQVVNG